MLDHFETQNYKSIRGGSSVSNFFTQMNQPVSNLNQDSAAMQHSANNSNATSLSSTTNNTSAASTSSIESERLHQLELHNNHTHDAQQSLCAAGFAVDFNLHPSGSGCGGSGGGGGSKYEQLGSMTTLKGLPTNSGSMSELKPQMIPIAHGSDHQAHAMHMSGGGKDESGGLDQRSAALNFSQGTLHQPLQLGNQHGGDLVQALDDSNKNAASRSFDSSNLLAQSSTIWKSHQFSLGHFKHSVISDGFFHNPDLALSTWSSHGAPLGHHPVAASLPTHSALADIGQYASATHHSRASHLQMQSHQDMMDSNVKQAQAAAAAAAADQTSFMLHTMSQHHQRTSPLLSGHSSGHHQKTGGHQNHHHHLDSFNIRPHRDHVSYNFSMGECRDLYAANSRVDPRSQTPSIKQPFYSMHDRPDTVGVAYSHHQGQAPAYPPVEHPTMQQPSTSHSAGVKSTNSFQCNICGKIFPLKNVYQSHMKTHSQDKAKAKFYCQLCGSSFSQKTSLNRHMKSHTGERPFKCNNCIKAFSEKERLKIHMRTHTGEKPFKCLVCGKAFSQKSTVKRHQTVHTGEKKFRCDCGKGFANRGNLIAHIKTRGGKHHTE